MMGAATFVRTSNGVENNKRWVEGVLTGSASYATNGDTIPVNKLYGLTFVEEMWVKGSSTNNSGWTAVLAGTVAAPKVKLFATAATETANAVDVSGYAPTVRFYGV